MSNNFPVMDTDPEDSWSEEELLRFYRLVKTEKFQRGPYRTGLHFERAIFGQSSTEKNLLDYLEWGYLTLDVFREEVPRFIQDGDFPSHPPTVLGEWLYRHTARRLRRVGIDTDGFAFISAVNTALDVGFKFDGLFYLPSLGEVVTIDAFNLPPFLYHRLWEDWFEETPGHLYSFEMFQSDLYHYKTGWWNRKKNYPKADMSADPRLWATDSRPENHFILTPYDVQGYKEARHFSSLIAGYFIEVAGTNKMAQQSP